MKYTVDQKTKVALEVSKKNIKAIKVENARLLSALEAARMHVLKLEDELDLLRGKKRTEMEIREKIKQIETDYSHVLTGDFANIVTNAPRALIQLATTKLLEGLYFSLGENRPKYKYEKEKT